MGQEPHMLHCLSILFGFLVSWKSSALSLNSISILMVWRNQFVTIIDRHCHWLSWPSTIVLIFNVMVMVIVMVIVNLIVIIIIMITIFIQLQPGLWKRFGWCWGWTVCCSGGFEVIDINPAIERFFTLLFQRLPKGWLVDMINAFGHHGGFQVSKLRCGKD